MKPDFYNIPYLADPSSLLALLEGQEHLVVLESANTNHPNGRWSIISANPLNWTEIHNQKDSIKIEQHINELMSELPEVESDLPFTGGVLGLLSYDLGESHVRAQRKTDDLQNPVAAYGLYTWAFIFDHSDKLGHLVFWQDFGNSNHEDLIALSQQARNACKTSDFSLAETIKPTWTKQQYLDRFRAIKQYILGGDCYQINLTQLFRGKYNGSALTAYNKIKTAAKAPYATFFDLGDSQLASASPELFIEFSNNSAITKPIKGTRPRSNDLTADNQFKNELLSSEKDRAENIMIVDLLRNDLSKHGTNIKVDKLCELETFETVHHLVSTVSAEIPLKKYVKALLDAFPGGSITGAPKTRAMEIIAELEDFQRRFYCGSCFFVSSNKKVSSNILIRSFIFDNDTSEVSCWAGGGIVADSIGEEEYQESLDKISKLIEAIS